MKGEDVPPIFNALAAGPAAAAAGEQGAQMYKNKDLTLIPRGLTLRELGSRMGGMDYLAVRIAIQRMKKRLTADPAARSLVASAERILYSV